YRLVLLLSLTPLAGLAAHSFHGEVLSPNFPQGYPNEVERTWNISVPEGFGIELRFTHIDIEPSEGCTYDYVKVTSEDNELGLFCGQRQQTKKGSEFQETLYSPFNKMTITFKSDFSNEVRYTGFAAYYVAKDVDECEEMSDYTCQHYCNNFIGGYECSCRPGYTLGKDQKSCEASCSGDVFTDLSGVITSPEYPKPYPRNAQCSYEIQLDEGFQVILTFVEKFDVEKDSMSNCIDTLKVKAGGKEFGPFCGNKVPAKIETGSNMVKIIFHTDNIGDNQGWKIQYSKTAKSCPREVTANSRMEPQQERYEFKDTVHVTCLEGYEIVEGKFDVREFVSKCQRDGTWSSSYQCTLVDCGDPLEVDNSKATFLTEEDVTTYQAKVKYSCKEQFYQMKALGDGTYTCSANGEWKNDKDGSNPPECIPVCGKPSVPFEDIQRIIGGSPAKLGNFPWQVYIVGNEKGGGALISDQWVLTAAHVVDSQAQPHMYAGLTNRNKLDDNSVAHLIKERTFLHADWANGQKDFNNDIALVKLKHKVQMGQNVSPVCLPGKESKYTLQKNRLGHISGWGRTLKRDEAVVLMKAKVPVVALDDCKASLIGRGEVTDSSFTDNMVCAGSEGIDSCQGDSGGPLVFQDPFKAGHYFVGGIVSWGLECGSLGVYTKVSNYLDWIEKVMKGGEDSKAL
uniref:Complement C1s n=1 Tax=Latimeria chalumnae TaxID=7897 RepID=H3A0P3_LATCH